MSKRTRTGIGRPGGSSVGVSARSGGGSGSNPGSTSTGGGSATDANNYGFIDCDGLRAGTAGVSLLPRSDATTCIAPRAFVLPGYGQFVLFENKVTSSSQASGATATACGTLLSSANQNSGSEGGNASYLLLNVNDFHSENSVKEVNAGLLDLSSQAGFGGINFALPWQGSNIGESSSHVDSNKQGGGALVDSSCYEILTGMSYGKSGMPGLIKIKKTGVYEISSMLNLYMTPSDHSGSVFDVYTDGGGSGTDTRRDLPHGSATPIIQIQAARLNGAKTARTEIHVATFSSWISGQYAIGPTTTTGNSNNFFSSGGRSVQGGGVLTSTNHDNRCQNGWAHLTPILTYLEAEDLVYVSGMKHPKSGGTGQVAVMSQEKDGSNFTFTPDPLKGATSGSNTATFAMKSHLLLKLVGRPAGNEWP